MWTMDRSASSRMKSEFFAYPCPGYFPVSYLNENTAWTVYFPGAEMPAKGEIEVEVYEVSNAPEKISPKLLSRGEPKICAPLLLVA